MQVHIQNDGPVTIELESPVVEEKVKTNKKELKSPEEIATNENGEKA